MTNYTIDGYLVTEDSITVVLNKQTKVVGAGHPHFDGIKAALKSKNFDQVVALINTAERVNKFGNGKIQVRGGVVFYGDHAVDNSLTKRILRMEAEGFDINPMVNFLERLLKNPSNRSVQELYNFLAVNNLPITEDGYFLAYKRIRNDWKDFYTGTIDNSLGKVVEMPRFQVNDNKDQTCSTGLHFCSLEYLTHYHGGQGRIVIVKIDPADVVSIPVDYNNSKGRCCRYTVLTEHSGEKVERFEKSVYSASASTYTPAKPTVAPAPKATAYVDEEEFDWEVEEAYEDLLDECDITCCGGLCDMHGSKRDELLAALEDRYQAGFMSKEKYDGIKRCIDEDFPAAPVLKPATVAVAPAPVRAAPARKAAATTGVALTLVSNDPNSTRTNVFTPDAAAARLGISRDALRKRLARGSSVERVVVNGREAVRIK